MSFRSALVATGLLLTSSALAQQPGRWWARAAVGAGTGSTLCDRDAASWICSSHSSSALGLFDLTIGRAIRPTLSLGFEISPLRQHLARDAFNESSLTTVSGSLVAVILPLHQGPLFFHVGLGAVGFRLRELNNGSTFVEHGMGWHTSVGTGADFHLARRLLLGPFIRFDYSEFGSAKVFFERLQHRVVALGLAITLR